MRDGSTAPLTLTQGTAEPHIFSSDHLLFAYLFLHPEGEFHVRREGEVKGQTSCSVTCTRDDLFVFLKGTSAAYYIMVFLVIYH